MQFDAILDIVGEFGSYQKRVYFLLCLPVMCVSMYDIISVYLMFTPLHRCSTLNAEDVYNNNGNTIPYEVNISEEYKYGECFVEAINNRSRAQVSNITRLPCLSWTYDQTVFTSTFVSEHNLICDDSSVSAYMQVAMHCGSIVGSLLQGIISDRFGRKTTFCGSTTMVMLAGVGSAFSTNLYLFTLLRFIQTICSTSIYVTAFVLGLELVGPSKRLWTGILINYFYTFGLIILSGIGYGLRNWKYIQIACSAPAAIFLVYWWLIPESPRWLISQGKQKEAMSIILKIAKSNDRQDIVTLEQLTTDEDESVGQHRIWHLLTTRVLLLRSLVIGANWFVIALAYYGFYFNAGNLSGDFYLNQLISGLVEIPATFLLLPLLDTIGRMKLFILGMCFGGVFLLTTGLVELFISDNITTVVLAMLGKLGVTVGFSVMYLWAAELFPTPLRSSAMGLGCACSNIGYILTPYIVQVTSSVSTLEKALPLLLVGGLSLAASFMTLLLPETANENLPETLQRNRRKPKR
ncbi:organic cation transporter protein-like isoform X2 [Argopecten irradians]|uniref:organic cation transporter protein-like isoform X2 n=1 Tax=Argopecten irradians TaxID=31199 RepID=UPI0037229EB9